MLPHAFLSFIFQGLTSTALPAVYGPGIRLVNETSQIESSSSSSLLDRSQNATTSCHAGQRYINTSNQCWLAGQAHLVTKRFTGFLLLCRIHFPWLLQTKWI